MSWDVSPAADTIKGAKDHPLLTRFESARLVGYDVKKFDELALPAGKIIRGKDNEAQFENSVTIEGKITRIAYNYPKDRSALEVMRNYQAAMEKAGVKPVFSCVKEACADGFGEKISQRMGSHFVQGGEAVSSPFIYGRRDSRYLLSKGVRSDGSQVYVALYVVQPVAEDMAKRIASEGKVAIYGVYFDTDKAGIQPESKAALDEMAKLLRKNPALKVYIVGHTDSQGALAGNIALSQKRAEAVAKALSTEHKIDAKRLTAKGVASFAPVSSNDTDAGRVQNRRVELVKQ
ncbi:MAG TPA: OmpA family protein [Myxococcaceae bacterium]|jgi:outer membrane protein OmpA-like peptidoglycan-associated protein